MPDVSEERVFLISGYFRPWRCWTVRCFDTYLLTPWSRFLL